MKKHNPELTFNARKNRKDMTPQEKHLWYDFLRMYPVNFLKQKVIDNYIVDFYCPKAKLVIEIDGGHHYTKETMKYDKIRTDYLEDFGLKIIRISNNDVNNGFYEVCEHLDREIQKSLSQLR